MSAVATMLSWVRRSAGTILVIAGIGLTAFPAAAQFTTPTGTIGGPISEIRIEGSQRIAPETVRAYLTIQPGEAAEADQLDKSLKALFGTGLFADVAIRQEGATLVVRVVENPIVNRIAFEGNRKLKDENLVQELSLKPRTVFTRAKVQADVKRLQDIYRRTGRFAATIEPKTIQLPQNRVDLVFEINEGQVTGVERINFVGNKTYADGTLREQIQTRESRWFRFLSTDDVYDPDRLSYDRELLRKYYLSNGYADFRVVSAVAELSPDREGFYVTFTLEEGERYKFGDIEVSSQLRDLKQEDLESRLKVAKGKWYNADLVDGTVTALTDFAGSVGYAFAEVRPRVKRDRENKTVSIVFEIQEGPRVYVERINIVGNARTVDKVIRREMALVEGDAFNTSKMRTSRRRIQNLHFFDRVEVTNVPGEAPDRTVINVEVNEKSTGELTFGIGFSSADGPLLDVSVRERNLLGRGQDLRLGGTLSGRRNQIDLGFTSPYFLDRNMSAGFDAFHVKRDFQREAGYDYLSTGLVLRDNYSLSENLKQQVRYTIKNDDITNINYYASDIVKDASGSVLQSGFGHTTTYDRRDDTVDPTDGYAIKLSNDMAGAGGDAKFLRSSLAAQYFYPVSSEVTLSLLSEVANIFAYSNDRVRLQNRLQLGGDNFRGFRSQGLGPRDRATGSALGGNTYYVGTTELAFPLGLPRELGMRGTLFSDFGALYSFDRPEAGRPGATALVDDSSSIRMSVGTGINWRSPFGPIRIAFAKAIVKQEFDKTELFRFSFGSRF